MPPSCRGSSARASAGPADSQSRAPRTVPVASAEMLPVVSSGSVSKIGDFGILDDNGKDFYEAELGDDFKKVGLDVYYAGFVTDGKIALTYISPDYFEYGSYVSHVPGINRASGSSWSTSDGN